MSTVDTFFAKTDGGGELSTTSDTMADVPGLTVTVTEAEAGDQLVIKGLVACYTSGAASNVKLTILVGGAAVRAIVLYGGIDGNVRQIPVEWVYDIQPGDITADETIVKVQWCKYSAGSGTCLLLNTANGVGTLSVIRIKTT